MNINSGRGIKARRGFTLIELIVVIAIIVVIVSILLPALILAKNYAKESAIRTYLSHLSGALEKYHADFNFYPDSGSPNVAISPNTIGNTYAAWPLKGTLVGKVDWSSGNGPTGTTQLTSGSARLAEAMVGYIGYGTFTNPPPSGTTGYGNDGDGCGAGSPNTASGSINPEPQYGFRMATSKSTDSNGNITYVPPSFTTTLGRVSGPYMTVASNNYGVNTAPATLLSSTTSVGVNYATSITYNTYTDQYFVDPVGNRILYYKAHGVSTNPPTTLAPTNYFSTSGTVATGSGAATGIFYSDDNYLNGNTWTNVANPPSTYPLSGMVNNVPNQALNPLNGTASTNLSPVTASGSAPGTTGFFKLLGNTKMDNNINSGESPIDTATYLLVSPGLSGNYFDGNNIINTK